jgi:multiple sugar transport system substrate-binding protein
VRPRRAARRALGLLAAVALLGACTTAAAPPAPTVLRVVMADDWASAPIVTEVIAAFEREHEGVRVQLQGSPFSQIPDVISSAVELGQPHDLAHWHAFAAAAAGLAEPIDDLWDDAGLTRAEWLPGAVEDVEWLDALYGVPLDVNALVLMANEDRLAAASLTTDELATPDGFRAAAGELVGSGAVEHAITVTASSWATYGWIVANGGQLLRFGEDGVPTFTFDDPATIGALDLLADLVRDGQAPPPFAPDLALDSVAAFSLGEVALHSSGSWDLPLAQRARQSDIEVPDVEVLRLPQADPDRPATVLGGSSLFVPVGAANRELAFELMLALTEDDIALELALTEGRLPARARVYENPVFSSSPDLAAFVDILPDARVMTLIAYPEIAAGFRDALEAILSLRETPQEAMAQLQAFAEQRPIQPGFGEG